MSSGSTVSDDFVLGRKLLVHLAENGHSLEFECNGSTILEAIQRSIETLCGIPVGDQLLLCRDQGQTRSTSLDPQQPLSHYKLPQDDREVFLYNKARLHADAPPPAAEAIEVPEAASPPPPSPGRERQQHPLDGAADPALLALVSYERSFRYHFQLANAVYGCTQGKFEVCKRLLREQKVQARALDTARCNLEHTFRKLQQRYEDFVRCFRQQHRGHSDLLANFERDVERLRSLKLHPALQTESRKCLLDFVKEDELRSCAEGCFHSHRQFEVKVLQLKGNFGELKKRVDSLFQLMNSAGCVELEHMISEHQKTLSEQKSIMQSLSKDVNTAKKHVDDASSGQLSASLRPHDAVSAVGRIYDVHEKGHLPNMQNYDHAISKLLDKCKAKKNDMNLLVHGSMQKVKSVQISIKDMMNELHAFQEVMGHQEKEFENLKFVNGIGHAYRACLAEVVRRKSSGKLYMGLAGQLAERLAIERDTEIRRREGFFKAWCKYIPHDIMASMGLFNSPSQCDVNIAPSDSNLLDIDVVDVDRYAPQVLVGVLPKHDKIGAPKSGLATSSNSSNLTKSGESSLHTGEKTGFQEFLDCSDPVDISGTSKLEVENARLKAELASAIALICSFNAEIGYESVNEGNADDVLKTVKEKTAEALHLKDEYAKHLQSQLNMKQEQCLSYEKRIEELEQRLSDQYLQGQKLSASKDASGSVFSAMKPDDYKSDLFGGLETHIPYVAMPMDEVSCTSASVDPRLDQVTGQPSKPGEGGDENMTDLSGTLNIQSVDCTRPMDSSMVEPPCDEQQVNDIDREVGMMSLQLNMTNGTSDVSTGVRMNILSSGTAAEMNLESKPSDALVSDLQTALAEKSNQLEETENKLNAVMEEVNSLTRELEMSRNLLDESQMNCAHLENCLHEAREEAHTNLCAADRRASEYKALRAKAVKMHSLFERFRNCVTTSGVAGVADSLRSLALSLGSSPNEDEDDVRVEFQQCITVLADKVGFLSRHRAELLDRCSRADAAHGQLVRDLEDKKDLIKSLYTKHQLEKQANKEKISFGRFEVHELAAFVLNSAGHYEAINRNCSNYYLSKESVALFSEQHPGRPTYIIGQIVHIERQNVKPPTSLRVEHSDPIETLNSDSSSRRSTGSRAASNPYNLPVGCEYFIVTVAMLPDTIHSNPS